MNHCPGPAGRRPGYIRRLRTGSGQEQDDMPFGQRLNVTPLPPAPCSAWRWLKAPDRTSDMEPHILRIDEAGRAEQGGRHAVAQRVPDQNFLAMPLGPRLTSARPMVEPTCGE